MKIENLSDKAYNIIKGKLIYAEKGSYLSIKAYADEMNMSYTPVREALLRLHKEGLLQLVPNVGFFTTEMDTGEILKVFQVRECIEPYVLKKVFHLITDKHIIMLEECIEEQKHQLEANDIAKYIKADEQFHKIIMDIYNNTYISKLYKNVREHYLICSNKIAETQSKDAIDEHIQLTQYIKDKDFDNAVSTLSLHFENAKQRVKGGYKRVINIDSRKLL